MKKRISLFVVLAILSQMAFLSIPAMAANNLETTANVIGVESDGTWEFNDGSFFLEGTDFQLRNDNAYGLITGGARWTDNGFLVYRFDLYKNAVGNQTQLQVKIAGGSLAIEFSADNIDYALACGKGGNLDGDSMDALLMGESSPDSDPWFAIPVPQKYIDAGVLYVRFSNSSNYANEPYYTRMGFAGGGPWLAGFKMVQSVSGNPAASDAYSKSYEVTNFGTSQMEAPFNNYIAAVDGAAVFDNYIYTDFASYVVLELPVKADTAKAYVELALLSGNVVSISKNKDGPFTQVVDARTGGAGWASGAPGEAFAGYLTLKRIDLDSSYAGGAAYVKISNINPGDGNGGRILSMSMYEFQKAASGGGGGSGSGSPKTGHADLFTVACALLAFSGIAAIGLRKKERSRI